jgi:hypothetical protein
MSRKIKIFSKLISAFFLAFFPILTSAASLGFVLPANKIGVGDIFVAEFKLVAGREEINAIDGELTFDTEMLNVQEVSTGGSIFNIWARTPVFSNESGKIMFAGGSPNGIKEDGLVFKIIFTAKKEGVANFSVSPSTTLYLNDGLGTSSRPIISNGELAIQEISTMASSTDSWQEVLVNDKLGPTNLSLLVGRDPFVFEGKYFLTITAQDEQSGLDHFEVKEGNRAFVRTESPYILQDQSLRSTIMVMAVDRAGNVSVAKIDPTISPTQAKYQGLLYALLSVTLLLLLVAVAIIIKMKNKNIPRPKNVSKRKTKSTK